MTRNPLERKLGEPGILDRLTAACTGRRYVAYSFGAEGEIMNTEGDTTPEMQDLKVFMQELRDLVAPFAHAVRGTIFVGRDMAHLMFNLQPVGISDLKLPSVDIHWMPPFPDREPSPEEAEMPTYRICTYEDTQVRIPSLTDLVMILADPVETVKLIITDDDHVPGYVRLLDALGLRIPVPTTGATQFSISSMTVNRI